MGKLVVLKLGEGSFEQGFPVTLQIGEEGKNPKVEITGKLPPAPELSQNYSRWAKSYHSLGLRSRLEASRRQVTNVSKLETCTLAAQSLRAHLNQWLASEPFRPIREKLLEQLIPSEAIRLIVQTETIGLRRLPWHLWDFCDRYSQAEIALSSTNYKLVEQVSLPHTQVRILAIIGNSTGINTQADRQLLEQLPNAQVSFLVEPRRQELTEELWRQEWDILFFAGHSSSHPDGTTGQIYLNQTDSLTIDELKYALKKAVERRLKIAIFNSCDGLGLACDLANLEIPQMIVMREPVPDRVSQEFLKYFLEAFSRGEPFYLAVREARERLQGLEDQFPCATWLPVICQNPAVSPPTWQELWHDDNSTRVRDSGVAVPLPEPPVLPEPAPRQSKPNILENCLRRVLLSSLVVTSLVLGVRHQGILQPLELQAFDHLMRTRPEQLPDSRLLVVKITEDDIKAQQNDLRPKTSLSDRALAQLLEKLESYQARVIGLDIYRDFPVAPEYPALAARMKNSDRLIAVCKVSNPDVNDSGVAPPPELSGKHLGFSDVELDTDQVLRRHLLAMTPPATSPCSSSYAFSTQLALRFLETQGISRQITDEGYLQLGQIVFKPIESRTGGYQNIPAWGHQILLNYRYHRSPEQFVEQVTLSQVLNNQVNAEAVKDKLVLIGVTAPSRKDYFYTPYSRGKQFEEKMPGVIVQAQMVSQILSAVLDKRPLLWVWPVISEVLWILGWSLVGGLLAVYVCSWRRWGLMVVAVLLLYGFCYGLLLQGGWVPLVPAALALVLTGGSMAASTAFVAQRKPSTFILKSS